MINGDVCIKTINVIAKMMILGFYLSSTAWCVIDLESINIILIIIFHNLYNFKSQNNMKNKIIILDTKKIKCYCFNTHFCILLSCKGITLFFKLDLLVVEICSSVCFSKILCSFVFIIHKNVITNQTCRE